MNFGPHPSGSRPLRSAGAWLLLVTLALLALPAEAHADRVVLYPVMGRASDERLEAVRVQVEAALRDTGHEVLAPSGRGAPPTTGAPMGRAAQSANAAYVVVAEVEPLRAQYRLHLWVYTQDGGRLEEIVATVMEATEESRLRDLLGSIVRPEGLGEDAVRLTGEEEDAEARARREAEEAARREAEEAREREQEAEALAAEEAERARRAAEAAEREAEEQARIDAEEAEARAARDAEAWENRPRYGTDGPWMISVGAGGSYALSLSDRPDAGGGLFHIGARVGRTFEEVEGLEIRAGLDFTSGAVTGLGLSVGAAWLGSFFTEPVYIGAALEAGVLFAFTGSRDVGFVGRIGPVVAWRPVEHLYFELAPDVGVITVGEGAVTFGAQLRGGYRF